MPPPADQRKRLPRPAPGGAGRRHGAQLPDPGEKLRLGGQALLRSAAHARVPSGGAGRPQSPAPAAPERAEAYQGRAQVPLQCAGRNLCAASSTRTTPSLLARRHPPYPYPYGPAGQGWGHVRRRAREDLDRRQPVVARGCDLGYRAGILGDGATGPVTDLLFVLAGPARGASAAVSCPAGLAFAALLGCAPAPGGLPAQEVAGPPAGQVRPPVCCGRDAQRAGVGEVGGGAPTTSSASPTDRSRSVSGGRVQSMAPASARTPTWGWDSSLASAGSCPYLGGGPTRHDAPSGTRPTPRARYPRLRGQRTRRPLVGAGMTASQTATGLHPAGPGRGGPPGPGAVGGWAPRRRRRRRCPARAAPARRLRRPT